MNENKPEESNADARPWWTLKKSLLATAVVSLVFAIVMVAYGVELGYLGNRLMPPGKRALALMLAIPGSMIFLSVAGALLAGVAWCVTRFWGARRAYLAFSIFLPLGVFVCGVKIIYGFRQGAAHRNDKPSVARVRGTDWEFSVEFPGKPATSEGLAPDGVSRIRRESYAVPGGSRVLLAESFTLPPEAPPASLENARLVARHFAEKRGARDVSCAVSGTGPVCGAWLDSADGRTDTPAMARMFFGRRTILMLIVSGAGLRAEDPAALRFFNSARFEGGNVPVSPSPVPVTAAPPGHEFAAVLPGRARHESRRYPGWEEEIYSHVDAAGNGYMATFMTKHSALSETDLKAAWQAQLRGVKVGRQSCASGGWRLDCRAVISDKRGRSVELRYIGGHSSFVVLSGETAVPGRADAPVAAFLNSAYRQR